MNTKRSSEKGTKWLLLCTLLARIITLNSCSASPTFRDSKSGLDWMKEAHHDSNGESVNPSNKIKRSADDYEEFILAHRYDPYSEWDRKSTIDPNEASYLESIGRLSRNYPVRLHHLQSLKPSAAKRFREMTASGFHGDTFSNGFGGFHTMKRFGMNAKGFHGNTFSDGFGDFHTMRKRRPEMDSMGFHGDMFSNGFGDFQTMKKSESNEQQESRIKREIISLDKRRPEMTSNGFHGDLFNNGFGDFYTMKRNQFKRLPDMTASGFHGDTFSNGFGDFYTMKRRIPYNKRMPEMTSSGFHGDTFSNGFGNFYTMKRRPEMTSSGFYGDTFSNGFGDFYTMRKRLREIDSAANEILRKTDEDDTKPDHENEIGKAKNDFNKEVAR